MYIYVYIDYSSTVQMRTKERIRLTLSAVTFDPWRDFIALDRVALCLPATPLMKISGPETRNKKKESAYDGFKCVGGYNTGRRNEVAGGIGHTLHTGHTYIYLYLYIYTMHFAQEYHCNSSALSATVFVGMCLTSSCSWFNRADSQATSEKMQPRYAQEQKKEWV